MNIESLFIIIFIMMISTSIFALLKYSILFQDIKAVVVNSVAASAVIWFIIISLTVQLGLFDYSLLLETWYVILNLFVFTILAFSLVFYNLKTIEQERNSMGYFICSIISGVFLVAIQCNFYLELTGFDTYILNNTLLFAVLHTILTLFLLTRLLQQVRFDQLHAPEKVRNVSLAAVSLICGHSLLGALLTVTAAFNLTVNRDLFNIEYISAILLFVMTVAKGERQYLDERGKLNYMAYHDSLTGLYNRSYIQDILAEKTSGTQPFRLLLLDLDYFKHINDTHGHFFGDEVLKQVAVSIKTMLGRNALAGRLGGDEFVILFDEQQSDDEVEKFCSSILDYFSSPIIIDGRQVTITASIGVSAFPDNAHTPGELLVKADISMYKTKGDGRNSFTIFNDDLEKQFRQETALQADLSRALLNREFEVFYQPMVSLKEKKVIGFEALLRWNHPERGMVNPGEFIHIAEETGLIVPIGEWVVHEACRQIHEWNQQLNKVYSISINLSLKQFARKDIYEVLTGIVKETGLPSSLVTIEITESMAMTNTDHTLAVLKKFKASGFGISIDDFGTGYSSLSYLKDFSIHSIKIDRSFIKSVTDSGKDDAIVKAILSIAGNLGLEVVAEGVELPQQEHFLLSQHCNYAQGYHYSKPLNSRDLLEYLEKNSGASPVDPVPI
ncbi:putative bifunctional diguanylate cyclase/phosphodiesterase [Bacillus salacetis]|uniref:putative bifunctional diguanylate cyclase/phosphodiesterase n=1 Tax=Bacillus salacetis TaxID=2315464 RepID=UPI003BA1E3EF